MQIEDYTGSSSAMRDSKFLACEDIEGLGDVTVEIEGVKRVADAAVQDGRKLNGFALKFKGKDKMMVTNATNTKSLTRAFGVDTKKWAGQKVIIYIQDNVKSPKGGITRGLRVKVDTTKQNKAAANSAVDAILNQNKPQ